MFNNNTPDKGTSSKRKRSESNKEFTKDTLSPYGSLTEQAINHLTNIKKFKENIQHTDSYLATGTNQNVRNISEDYPTTSVIKTTPSELLPEASNEKIIKTADKSKNRSKLKNNDYVQTKIHIKKENVDYVSEIRPHIKIENADYVGNEIKPHIKIEILDESDNENVINVKSEVLTSDDDQITIKQEPMINNSDSQIQVKREVDDVKIKHEILAINEKDIKIEIISSEDELAETSVKSEASSYDFETDFYMYLGDVIVISDSEEERDVVDKTTCENEPIQSSKNDEVTTDISKPFNSKSNVKQSNKIKQSKYTEHGKTTARTTNHKETQKEIRARTVVVRNLPESVKETDLRTFFSRYGPVERTYMSRRNCKTPSAKYSIIVCCFIRFQKRDNALKALEVNGMEFRKHHFKVDICKCEKDYYPDRTIFVRNIPRNAEDDDLWNIFESCGLIKSITLVRNKSTRSVKGIGYITFESAYSAKLALKMKNVKLGKCHLKMKGFDISKLSKRSSNKTQQSNITPR